MILFADCPGALNDSAASKFIAINALPKGVLADKGYPAYDARFELPPGESDPMSVYHSDARSVVERFFAKLKLLWKMIGNKYMRQSKWHGTVIRCCVILTNMLIVHEGGLNQR